MDMNKAFRVIRKIAVNTRNGEFQLTFDKNQHVIRIIIMTDNADLGYYRRVIDVLNKTAEIKTRFDDDRDIILEDSQKPEPKNEPKED